MTPREHIYMRHTGAKKLVDEDYLIWFNNAKRRAMHQRDLFTQSGKIKDEGKFLAWLRLHYPAKEA